MVRCGGDVDDGAFGLDDKRGERLGYGQRAPEVDVGDKFGFVDGGINRVTSLS